MRYLRHINNQSLDDSRKCVLADSCPVTRQVLVNAQTGQVGARFLSFASANQPDRYVSIAQISEGKNLEAIASQSFSP